MDTCIFCKIAEKSIPSHIIYEDESVIAFLDIQPFTHGHTLLIPKMHYRWLWDIEEDTYLKLMSASRKLANHYRHISNDDLVVSLSMGELVPHAHFHLIPNGSTQFTDSSKYITANRLTLSNEELVKIKNKFSFDIDE